MEENIKMKEKKVVVAVDESEESMYALSWCLSDLFAQNSNPNSTLILLYIKPPVPVYSSLDVTGYSSALLHRIRLYHLCLNEYTLSGYLFAGDVIQTIEKYSRDLANSVMRRADAVCRNFNSAVSACVFVRNWFLEHVM